MKDSVKLMHREYRAFSLTGDGSLHEEGDKRKTGPTFVLFESRTGATQQVAPVCNSSSAQKDSAFLCGALVTKSKERRETLCVLIIF